MKYTWKGRPRQFLPVDPGNFCRQIPLTVPVQAETIKKRNSRTRGEPPETIAALEDGEKKDLSNGNGETLTPLATENAPRGKDVPGAGGKSSGPRACPGCGKAMETAGKTRMNPEGTHLACFRCGIQNARGEIADPVVAVAPGDPAPSPGESPGHEYLRRLRKGSSSADCDLAYQVLCKAFGSTDARDSSKAYRSYVNRVRRGFLSVDVLTYAFTQATHPSAINPGKIFAYNIAHRIRPKSDG